MLTSIMRMFQNKFYLAIIIYVILENSIKLTKCDMVYLSSMNVDVGSSLSSSSLMYGGSADLNINKRGLLFFE